MATAEAEATTAEFDYGIMAVSDRVWLRRAAAELRVRLRRTVTDIVSSGQVLVRARRRLGRGAWEPWLASEAQVPRRSAARLIQVHGVFGSLDAQILDHFTPTALYTLAEPGIPQSIREYAVEQARGGADITAGIVTEWVTLQRDTTLGSSQEATKDVKPVELFDADKVHAAENWLALVCMLGEDNTLHLSHSTDVENGDLTVSGTLISSEVISEAASRIARKTATGLTLEAVVLALAGERREKRCKGACKTMKPLDQFSKRRDSRDGRNHYCLKCESDRVKRYEKEKQKQAGQAGQPQPSLASVTKPVSGSDTAA